MDLVKVKLTFIQLTLTLSWPSMMSKPMISHAQHYIIPIVFISYWNFFIIQLKHLPSTYTFSITPSQQCILPNRNNKWFDRNSGSHCSFWLIPHVGVLFYLFTLLYLFSNVINNRNETNSTNIQSKLIIIQNWKLFNLVLIFFLFPLCTHESYRLMNHNLKNFFMQKDFIDKIF